MLALQNEPNRYIKLEAGWILTNIAYGDEDDFVKLFTNQNFVNIINSFLQDPDNYDMQLIDQIMFLFGNMTGSSHDFCEYIISEYNIVDVIIGILEQSQKQPVSMQFANNYVWIALNIS